MVFLDYFQYEPSSSSSSSSMMYPIPGASAPPRIVYRARAEAKASRASSEYLALNSNVYSSDNRCLICLLHIFFNFKLYIVYMYTFH